MEPGKRVVGVKQSRKAIREGRASRVYLASDADPALTEPIAAECAAAGIPVEAGLTMAQLGRACGIAVGASAAADLKA
ncbi:MAG: 50S ribosomal protein L7ae-like protein [Oscillibacter sp.]|nr:50S ribosomal protein L7ae-like protein [Oscillibacter sp.]